MIQTKSQHTLFNIQLLRAFAAILVIMHHTLAHYEAMGGNLFIIHIISQWGFLGVDIFFIISGFIMAYTTFHKERTLQNAKIFVKHRLFRIFFGYWPFFLVMLAILYVTNPSHLQELDMFGSFLLMNDNMFKLILPISWSLSYELYFYLLFAFTFFIPAKYLLRSVQFFIFILLSFILYTSFSSKIQNSFFYSPFLLEFFLGVLLYIYRNTLTKLWLLPISILFMLLSYYYGITHETKNGILRIATFGMGAFFMVLSLYILEQKYIFTAPKFFVHLGDASYTLYLSHLIILELFYMIGLRNLFQSTHQMLPLLGFLTILSLCIVFSIYYYQKIEKPLYKKSISI